MNSPCIPSRVIGLVLLLFPLSAAATPHFSNLFVFGDSLSDAGNVFVATGGQTSTPPFAPVPSLPYAGGRFSNGPVAVEQFALQLGLSAAPRLAGGTNYAFGGARTGPIGAGPVPTLLEQLGIFLGDFSTGAPSDALYWIWGGANDVRDALLTIDPALHINAAVNNISTVITLLALAGATDFLVPNLPDLGLTPEAQAGGPAVVAGAAFLTNLFNTALDVALDALAYSFSLNIIEFDVFDLVNQVAAAPTDFGLTNATDPCLRFGESNPTLAVCPNPAEHVFWDGIHPTTAMHGVIAAAAVRAVPEPTSLALLGIGLVGLGWMGRRRKTSG